MKIINSCVQTICFNGFEWLLKRDDLLHTDFSGNKARKLFYFLTHDLPHIKKVISFGSVQSNAMYSLSVLCKQKGWEFEYYTKEISSFLKQNPIGNYEYALANGMKLFENQAFPTSFDNHTLCINEGAFNKESEYGIAILANEIKAYAKENCIKELEIFLPSGTGTTALFLQKHLPFKVLTTPCVGDAAYLMQQFKALSIQEVYPTILMPPKKYHFGKLYKSLYEIHHEALKQTQCEFDLLYDSLGLMVLQEYLKQYPKKKIMYIHQGGIIGNISMKQRYKRKYNF
jgi:1-aminocyclopropane-1-carboxylate deaminase/D-cysteine desulfhydrase-like pyridoxal-dependent ACC family enzyme